MKSSGRKLDGSGHGYHVRDDLLATVRSLRDVLAEVERQAPGYNWNADPHNLTLLTGRAYAAADAAIAKAEREVHSLARAMSRHAEEEDMPSTEGNFRSELEALLNQHSMENTSNTPDFILADYLYGCLLAFDQAVQKRENWYGRDPRPSSSGEVIVDLDAPATRESGQ